jgi:hypothetical protein
VRKKIAEAAVERKALIKAITDFIRTVLPDITLTQKVATPKIESEEYGTQTAPPPPTRVVPLSSTSTVGGEAETSPVSTRFAGSPALQLPTMMIMEKLGQLAKAMYTHLLGSLLVQMLALTYHHMITDMAFSIQRTACVK